MDSNITTYFDAPQGSGDWVGIDLGLDTSALITRVSYVPRSNFPLFTDGVGGLFQAANLPGFQRRGQPGYGVLPSRGWRIYRSAGNRYHTVSQVSGTVWSNT